MKTITEYLVNNHVNGTKKYGAPCPYPVAIDASEIDTNVWCKMSFGEMNSIYLFNSAGIVPFRGESGIDITWDIHYIIYDDGSEECVQEDHAGVLTVIENMEKYNNKIIPLTKNDVKIITYIEEHGASAKINGDMKYTFIDECKEIFKEK